MQDNFTLTETLQISALLPCLFLAFYLVVAIKNKKLIIIPSIYFISISAGLLYALIYSDKTSPDIFGALLMWIDNLMPALAFLLIVQLTTNSMPTPIFWVILAVPALAGTPFIYAVTQGNFVCADGVDSCFSSIAALRLNKAIVAASIFMLLTVIFARRSSELEGNKISVTHKYWLIICLIIYNLILIAVELAAAGEFINNDKYQLAKTLIKIAFIYMVMSSIFRVFSDHFAINSILAAKPAKTELSAYEVSVAARAEKILKEDKAYRESGFNRANFAKKLGVREHVLSRIINMHFKKSFSELANEYRIGEAKEKLSLTDLSITTIAYDAGFSSITSFNRVFREEEGMSPSEYRELHTAKNKGSVNA